MSSLLDQDKRYLEELFKMDTGFVLDFKDASYGAFFRQYGVDIHGDKYQTHGTSKAKKLRAFWEQEPDPLVGRVLSGLLNSYETYCELNDEEEINVSALGKARAIVGRLMGKPPASIPAESEADFLDREFDIPNIQDPPVVTHAVPIIEARLAEARVVLKAGASLSVIFLCGSVLEAVLLGAAQDSPAIFNQAKATPKAKNGSPRRFHEWSLAQLIDVACEVGVLKPDIQKFSHGLRDYRNYIHPYEEMASGFTPDGHTAKVCFQVLKAALASVAGER